jgi:pre-rRNA-processing protein IPI1
MSTKRKSGGQAQSDFKRIKAKVGKRTPRSANVTETSFKAASLHVAGQLIDRSQGPITILSSTRGNTMLDLSAQLGHPAAAVRLSAIKGLGDIARNHAPYLLRPHLSILVPTCAKSWVDEDDEVRTAGLSAFGDLIGKQNYSSIRPFVLLIISYFTSALHSLDSQMRVDGARAVNLVSSLHPRLLTPFVSKLLRPFVGLLTDRNKLRSNEEILIGLISLLEVSTDSSTSQDAAEIIDNDPDLSFVSGGRSRNTILLESRASTHFIVPFYSFQKLPSFEYLQSLDTPYGAESFVGDWTDNELVVAYYLLEKLRDILVEATEEDNVEYAIGRKPSTPQKKEKLLLSVLSPIGLLWRRKNRFCSTRRDRDTEKLDKLAIQIVSILLDLFPIRQGDLKSIDNAAAENLNSAICTTVMEIASSMSPNLCRDSEGNSLDWMVHLSSFLQPRLVHYKTDRNYSSSALNVFCDLLLLSNTSFDFPEAHRFSMLKQMQTVFFGEEEDISLARSPAGRKAVLTVAKLMKQLQYVVDPATSSLADLLQIIILKLRFYLIAWNSEFCYETNETLGLLYAIARSNGLEHDVVQPLRDGMTPIVVADKKKTGKSKQSTFESYPLSSQRRFLSLLVMLEKPSNDTLKGLASICAKSTTGVGISDEIVASITAIRTSISMKNYLQFLLTLIAAPTTSKKKTQVENESFDSFIQRMIHLDSGVKRVSRALIQCGSARVMQMLHLYLSDLLDSNSDIGAYDNFLRNRTAVSMLAMLALDIKGTTNAFTIPAQLDQALKQSIFQGIVFISSSSDTMAAVAKLLSPIVALFQVDAMLVVSLFDGVVDKMDEYKSRKELQYNMIQLLIDVVSDHRITETISGLGQLRCCVQSLELSLQKEAGSRNAALVGHLKALLEVRIGNKSA